MNSIEKYRRKFGLSQRDLADLCGVVPSTVSMWESGERVPRTVFLKKLCKIFDCSSDEVLGFVPFPDEHGTGYEDQAPEHGDQDKLVFTLPESGNDVSVSISWKANEMIEEIARISGQPKSVVASKMIKFAYDHTEIRAEEE